MRAHTLSGQRAAPAEMVQRYRDSRERTRALFEIPVEDAYYDRPIALRNPIVFYEGHLPAFAVNTLVKLAMKRSGIDARYEVLFERGIDPEDETAVRDPSETWPSRSEVRAYARAADALVEESLLSIGEDPLAMEAGLAIIEHEFMHQETLLYLFHNLPYERKNPPWATSAAPAGHPQEKAVVVIPSGRATLGGDGSHFGWDNEFPQHVVAVPRFEIDCDSVTNAAYLRYIEATGAEPPHFWARVGDEWFWRGMFQLIPLPLDWPVWVTQDEASAFARWAGRRLPTEAEYHRAAFGHPSGEERRIEHGNFDFLSWDPHPVGAHPEGSSAWGVRDLVGNGWEWTSTEFSGFDGFEPMPIYRQYSIDFFDGKHYVLKGASPVTASGLVRPSFRNWFRPNYPFVFAKFRTVR